MKALWSDFANRRLMISPSGGVEDKYGQYIELCTEQCEKRCSVKIHITRKRDVLIMLNEDWIYRRGDIYLVELEPRIGFVQGGTRPVIVLQNNCGNFFAPTIIVAPLTANIYKKRNLPTHYLLNNNNVLYPSIVMLEQITTIDKRQVSRYIGKVSRQEMENISECIEKSLGLYIPEEMEAP